ncbi:MAG: transglycosylase family protein [Acidimicrobiales bacterium]
MRKHPLIALTAFTALGASAIAGSTGSINSVLTSAKSTGHRNAARHHLRTAHSQAFPSSWTRGVRTAGRDLVAVHDVNVRNRSDLSTRTGLPFRPPPRHVVARRAPAPEPPATPAPAAVAASPTPAPATPAAPSGGVWYQLRVCESGNNYAENSGNGYYGAYQFALSTWYGLGFSGMPSQASPAVQDQAAAELQARSGWGQWPQCAAELGLY